MDLFIQIFYSDPFHYILPFLELGDIYSLACVSKYWKKSLYPYLVHQIIQNINCLIKKIFCDKTEDLLKILIKTNAIITGSFFVPLILNENWKNINEPAHIYFDIMVPAENCHILVEFLKNSENVYNEIFDGIKYYTFYYHSDIRSIRVLTISDLCSTKSYSKFIYHYSHFDICQNWFRIDENKYYLTIGNLDQIFSKNIVFKCTGNIRHAIKNCNKYLDKGFKLVGYDVPNLYYYPSKKTWMFQFIIKKIPDDKNNKLAYWYFHWHGYYLINRWRSNNGEVYHILQGDIKMLEELITCDKHIAINSEKNLISGIPLCTGCHYGINQKHFHYDKNHPISRRDTDIYEHGGPTDFTMFMKYHCIFVID